MNALQLEIDATFKNIAHMQAKFIAKLGNIQGDGGEFAVHLAQFRHPAAC